MLEWNTFGSSLTTSCWVLKPSPAFHLLFLCRLSAKWIFYGWAVLGSADCIQIRQNNVQMYVTVSEVGSRSGQCVLNVHLMETSSWLDAWMDARGWPSPPPVYRTIWMHFRVKNQITWINEATEIRIFFKECQDPEPLFQSFSVYRKDNWLASHGSL